MMNSKSTIRGNFFELEALNMRLYYLAESNLKLSINYGQMKNFFTIIDINGVVPWGYFFRII